MSRRVEFLIAMNLGLVACTEKPPINSEPAAPLYIPPMPSQAASAPPPVPPPPAPVPSPTATTDEDDDDDNIGPPPVRPPPPPPRQTCRTSKDCGGWGCVIQPGKKVGTCAPRVIRGRPLVVDGHEHVASYMHLTNATVTSEEIARLRDGAREEHASIAAFARTIAELMALGAPTWLLSETQAAMGDEIRHTVRTLDMLERLTGERPELGPLPAAVAPLARPAAHLFHDVLHGGAIGETQAAEEAEACRLASTDPELRDFYDMIVVDESRHAALAIKTLRWLAGVMPC